MDHTNAKQVTKMLLATCFVMVILAGGAFAASIILSNPVGQNGITVPENGIVLSAVTDLPTAPAKGVAYDLTVNVDYSATVSDAYLKLTITGTGILEGDVTVTYPDGGLYTVVWGTDTVTFTFNIPEVDGDVTLGVTFLTAGTYSTSLVVEATTP